MHALDVPRHYRTIYICDSFGIGGKRLQDAEALRRCHDHLAPGGRLIFNLYLPYDDEDRWSLWLPANRQQVPQQWPAAGDRRRAASGDEFELTSRLIDLDPLEQRLTRQIRVTLWRGGEAVTHEEHVMRESLYFRNEVVQMLAQAGFDDIAVHGGYTGAAATPEDVMLVFVARKRSDT
jgi:hypothetical protein